MLRALAISVHGAQMDAVKEPTGGSRRNRAYSVTHQELIEGAVRLISEKGVEALSVSGLARALKINRTTVYYHFASREALLEAVRLWSSEQLASAFSTDESQSERIAFIARFVIENPDLIKLWIEEFVSPGDIRDRYPRWDELVAGIAESLGERVDAEIYCTFLLTGAIIGPRVFRQSVRPDLDEAVIVERFRIEQQRMLARDSLRHD
ncbi:helix-turn-helix domain-containing protein [Sphingomonas oligophenolica]